MLCKKDVETEGGFHKHVKEECHILNKSLYDNNPGMELLQIHGNQKISEDFIDIIRKTYNPSSKNFIMNLINDYKRFKPVIFYSLYEHNSNSLSWRETQSEICVINTEFNNLYTYLEKKLKEYKNRYIKIGSFTSASNITGLLLDVDTLSILMHKYNGFAFFDYASGSPYLQIDMNNPLPDTYRQSLDFIKLDKKDEKYCFKDGIFFSPHKSLGGQNTPGVLIAHDRIYRNQLKPTQPGGGTVNFVYKNWIDYIQDVELKEESGTPNIIGGIRVGLMFLIRQKIPHSFIIKRDEYYSKLFTNELENIINLYILDHKQLRNKPHIPVYAIMVSYGERFFHPNFVCALLTDLFGIQSRPGCSCAPTYGQLLLGFDKDPNNFKLFQTIIYEGNELFKPGYVRLNLPYFYPEYVIKYIIKAIKFICEYGHLFISLYKYNIKSGKFWFYNFKEKDLSLKLFDFGKNLPNEEDFYDNVNKSMISKEKLDESFKQIENYVISGDIYREMFYLKDQYIMPRLKDYDFGEWEKVRWFVKLKDVQDYLVKMYKSVVYSYDNQNTYESVEKNEKKKLTRMENWSIRSQT
jgi:selenocysteine lyase/cysteine desulfurase